MSAISYRPDIDGLRAVAVIAVILFHLDKNLVPGGYVGVDIFFVISGFLITSIILKDLGRDCFTFRDFWARRVRRILPALIVMSVACLCAGWFLFLPIDYENLGKQAIAQSLFSSNILFYMQSGYFDAANETKPLLHTWSLAVEEQFYILFPLVMVFLWRFCREKLLIVLAGAFIISFGVSVYCVSHHPSFAFYMLPTRAWELLTGALIACVALDKRCEKITRVNVTLCGMAGVAMIGASLFFYKEDTPFPGIAALLPCLGAGLLILGGVNSTCRSPAHNFLSWKPVTFLGKVSYSWYLWHWPLIVFYKYFSLAPITYLEIFVLFFGSFALACLSWKYVETPFRHGASSGLPMKTIACSSLVILATLGLSSTIVYAQGYSGRFDPAVIRYSGAANDKNVYQKECNRPSLEKIDRDELCKTIPDDEAAPVFILWGDSHADAIAPAFYDLSKRLGINGYIATYDGCPPLLGIDQKNRGKDFYCAEFNDKIADFIVRKNIGHVYLVGAWTNWFYNKTLYPSGTDKAMIDRDGINQAALRSFKTTVNFFSKKDIKTYILHTIPTAPFDPPHVLAVQAIKNDFNPLVIDKAAYRSKRRAEDAVKKSLLYKDGVVFIDPAEYLCDRSSCRISENGYSLYYNGGHLSRYGALSIKEMFLPYLMKTKSGVKL